LLDLVDGVDQEVLLVDRDRSKIRQVVERSAASAPAITEAYSHATTVDQRGAAMLGDEMIDEASREMAEAIVARGNVVGFIRGETVQSPE
jgi:hypothetical protein